MKDPDRKLSYRSGSIGRVSFSAMPSTIGIGSYQINPFIEIREVGDRRPTPPVSILIAISFERFTAMCDEKEIHSDFIGRNYHQY